MITIFLDESGIHKVTGKFCVVLIYIPNNSLNEVDRQITEHERKMNIRPFHWSDHNWNFRRKFLHCITTINFTMKIFVSENPFEELKYQKAIRNLLTESEQITLVIDGKKSNTYNFS